MILMIRPMMPRNLMSLSFSSGIVAAEGGFAFGLHTATRRWQNFCRVVVRLPRAGPISTAKTTKNRTVKFSTAKVADAERRSSATSPFPPSAIRTTPRLIADTASSQGGTSPAHRPRTGRSFATFSPAAILARPCGPTPPTDRRRMTIW